MESIVVNLEEGDDLFGLFLLHETLNFLRSFVRSLARYEMKFDEFQKKKKKEKESRRIIDIKKISSHIV